MASKAPHPDNNGMFEVPIHLSIEDVARIARLHYGDVPPDAAFADNTAVAKHFQKSRRLRSNLLPGFEFADPAWDILLDLRVALALGRKVSVSSLCIAAAVPPTTALRWITEMTEEGQLIRHPDPRDGRRVFVSMSPSTAEQLERYLTDVRVMRFG